MAGAIEFVDGGTVTSPVGFLAGATYAGLKTFAEDKLDLCILFSELPCAAAGVFTKSAVRSSTVTVDRERLAQGIPIRGLIVNAGIANTCVGEQGYIDAVEMTRLQPRRREFRQRNPGVQHWDHRRGTAHGPDPGRAGPDRAPGQRRPRTWPGP